MQRKRNNPVSSEDEIGEMRPADWLMVFLIVAAVSGASICGFLQKWTLMLCFIGAVFICMSAYTMIYFRTAKLFASYAIAGAGVSAIVMAFITYTSGSLMMTVIVYIPVVFMLLGIVFIAYSVLIRSRQKRCSDEAIAAVQREPEVTLEYLYNGKNYKVGCSDIALDSELGDGDGLKIYLNPSKPTEICVARRDYGLMAILGVVFILTSAIIFSAAFIIYFSVGWF